MFRSFTMLLSLSVNLSGRSVWKRATLRGDLLTFHRIIIALRNCRIGMQDEIRIERIPLRVIALNYFVMSVIVLFVLFHRNTVGVGLFINKTWLNSVVKNLTFYLHVNYQRRISPPCFPSSRINSFKIIRKGGLFPHLNDRISNFFEQRGSLPSSFWGIRSLSYVPSPRLFVASA